MDKIGRNTDKGKEKAIYPVKARDFTRSYQEKLTLNPQRDILKGGMDKASSSKKKGETSKEQDTTEEHRITSDELTATSAHLNRLADQAKWAKARLISYDLAIQELERPQRSSEEQIRKQVRDRLSRLQKDTKD